MCKLRNRLVSILFAPFFLFGCKEEQVNSTVTLYYDFYQHDSVVLKKAIKIKYENVESRDYRKVIIETSEDSVIATFYQKTSDAGIFRSLDTVGFKISHSFLPKTEVELKLGNPIPYFLNVLTTNRNEKLYLYDNKDSAEVFLFDEAIPWHSYTCSYYLRKENIFLIFYNCGVEEDREYRISKNYYYRLSRVEGLDESISDLDKLSDKIIRDTSFFAKYYTFPSNPPPPPTK